jgi:hypothetical protein
MFRGIARSARAHTPAHNAHRTLVDGETSVHVGLSQLGGGGL